MQRLVGPHGDVLRRGRCIDAEGAHRTADLVANDQERHAIGAVGGAHELDVLGTQVERVACSGITGEVAVVEVLYEHRCGRHAHIIDHDATDALQPDEGVGAAVHIGHYDGFRLGALVVAAVIEGAVRAVVAVEVGGVGCGGDLLELITAVPYDGAVGVADGEGA